MRHLGVPQEKVDLARQSAENGVCLPQIVLPLVNTTLCDWMPSYHVIVERGGIPSNIKGFASTSGIDTIEFIYSLKRLGTFYKEAGERRLRDKRGGGGSCGGNGSGKSSKDYFGGKMVEGLDHDYIEVLINYGLIGTPRPRGSGYGFSIYFEDSSSLVLTVKYRPNNPNEFKVVVYPNRFETFDAMVNLLSNIFLSFRGGVMTITRLDIHMDLGLSYEDATSGLLLVKNKKRTFESYENDTVQTRGEKNGFRFGSKPDCLIGYDKSKQLVATRRLTPEEAKAQPYYRLERQMHDRVVKNVDFWHLADIRIMKPFESVVFNAVAINDEAARDFGDECFRLVSQFEIIAKREGLTPAISFLKKVRQWDKMLKDRIIDLYPLDLDFDEQLAMDFERYFSKVEGEVTTIDEFNGTDEESLFEGGTNAQS